ncbi:MAG: hypothetical protein V8T07_03760 [Muribaculaceae bacterium]|nr:hypothetical protein [Prevotella sp.]CCX44909.1 unknown [Prevotella sp. CAG:1031]
MKQIYLVLAAVAALLLTACGHGDDYRVACKEGNFDEAHDILSRLHGRFEDVYSEHYGLMEWHTDDRALIEAAASEYGTAATHILTTEARWLISQNDPETVGNALVNLFNELQPIGKRLPEGTGYHPGGTKSLQKDCADINCYREYVKANNALADVILDLAVHNRDEALLEVAVSHYLDEPEIVEDGYDQKVVYRRSDKLAKFVDFARSKGLDQVPGLMEAEDYGVELPEVEMPEVELPDVELPEQ